jgi:hypothetical protein
MYERNRFYRWHIRNDCDEEHTPGIQIKEVFNPKGGVMDLFKDQGQKYVKNCISISP